MAKLLSEYKGKIVQLGFDLPFELRRDFKMACLQSGEDMKEVLIDFILGYVDSTEGENRWMYTRLAKTRVSIHDLKKFEADIAAGLIDERGTPLTKSPFDKASDDKA